MHHTPPAQGQGQTARASRIHARDEVRDAEAREAAASAAALLASSAAAPGPSSVRPDIPAPVAPTQLASAPATSANAEAIAALVVQLLDDRGALPTAQPAARASSTFSDLMDVTKLASSSPGSFTADELKSLPDVITPGMASVPIVNVKRMDLHREVSKKTSGRGAIRPGSLLHELPSLLSLNAVLDIQRNLLARFISAANASLASQSDGSELSDLLQEYHSFQAVLEGPLTFVTQWLSELVAGRISSIEEFIEHGSAVSEAYTLGRFKVMGSDMDDVRSSMRTSIHEAKVKALATLVKSQFSVAATDSDSESPTDRQSKHGNSSTTASKKHKHKKHVASGKHAASHTAGHQPAGAQ
jgi:hypothetical protein